MNPLHFDFEWQDPLGATGDELRATWASLNISIGDQSVSELKDQLTRSVRSAVFLPLFSLAEWFADNWWFLHAEVDRPEISECRDFDQRHNIRWAREGYALPALRFVNLGNYIEARWHPFAVKSAGIFFLADGQSFISTKLFTDELTNLIRAVISRLDEFGIQQTSLHAQWNAIENADHEERTFCRAAARLGVDPYSVDSVLESAILGAATELPPELLDELFSLSESGSLTSRTAELANAVDSIAQDADEVDVLAKLRQCAPGLISAANPWETGYRFARDLRDRLNNGEWKSHSLEELADCLGIAGLDHCILSTSGENHRWDALTGRNRFGVPKFLIDKRRPDSKQFAFCRALFEHLTSPERFSMVSHLRTTSQQMNRAFAAELLAPHTMLRRSLSGTTVSEEEVDEIACEYGVSPYVIHHQIENHRLAKVTV